MDTAISREDLENATTSLIAYVYKRINFGKFRTSKNPWDVFNHRVRFCSNSSTLQEFTSRLCNKFSIQSVNQKMLELLEYLKPYERRVLNLINQEWVCIGTLAIQKAKAMKEIEKNEKPGTQSFGPLFQVEEINLEGERNE